LAQQISPLEHIEALAHAIMGGPGYGGNPQSANASVTLGQPVQLGKLTTVVDGPKHTQLPVRQSQLTWKSTPSHVSPSQLMQSPWPPLRPPPLGVQTVDASTGSAMTGASTDGRRESARLASGTASSMSSPVRAPHATREPIATRPNGPVRGKRALEGVLFTSRPTRTGSMGSRKARTPLGPAAGSMGSFRRKPRASMDPGRRTSLRGRHKSPDTACRHTLWQSRFRSLMN